MCDIILSATEVTVRPPASGQPVWLRATCIVDAGTCFRHVSMAVFVSEERRSAAISELASSEVPSSLKVWILIPFYVLYNDSIHGNSYDVLVHTLTNE